MEISEIRPKEVVVEVICDCCGQSTTKDRELGVHEYATIAADWGYGSDHDGERYRYQLCETCFFGVLAYLRGEARMLGVFDEGHSARRMKQDRFDRQRDGSPLSRLNGSVTRFDRPTDPVWGDPEDR